MDKVNTEWAKEVPCRNVIIYGHCKKQKEGCPFKHDNDDLNSDINDNNNSNINTTICSINENNVILSDNIASLSNNNNNIVINHTQQLTPSLSPQLQLPSLTSPHLNQNPFQQQSSVSNSSNTSLPKFNAKNSASFTPISKNVAKDSKTTSSNIVTSSNSPLVKNISNLSISSNNINTTTTTQPLNFTPTFDAYNAETFTPLASNGNILENNAANSNINNTPNLLPTNIFNQSLPTPPPPPPPPAPPSSSLNGMLTDPSISLPNINQSNHLSFSNNPINNSNDNDNNNSHPINATNENNILPPHPNGLPPFRYPSIYPPPHSILQYHLYSPETPPQLKLPLKPNERTSETLFIPNNLREQLVKKNLASLQNFPPGGPLPDIVQDYFGLVPLDFHEKNTDIDRYDGHKNSLFKVFSNIDGKLYVLRRIHNIGSIESIQISKVFQQWNKLNSSNIIKLIDIFSTTKFGDISLCIVYDYYPKAISLYEAHFINFPLLPITQDYLWTYLIQLTNAVRSTHKLDLILGDCLNWEKILVTGEPGFIKISSIASNDLLNFFQNKNRDIKLEQQQDFIKLGNLLLKLAQNINDAKTNNNSSVNNNNKPVTINGNNIDKIINELNVEENFKNVLRYLINKDNNDKNINDLSAIFIDKIYSNFDSLKVYSEYVTKLLSRELENSRLFRLICKLNFIFGRIESRIDINWSESGERFPIILFYDFVFHQVDENGKPLLDLTHVLRCLNKLDAGASEKIVLATPDEMNCIIITYKELKGLIDSTFRLLTQSS